MDSILFKIEKNIAVVTLNRPEKMNAFDTEMALSLQNVLDVCAADKQIRAVFLTGSGKAFCAGQDLHELNSEKAPSFSKILAVHYNPIVTRIRNIEKPVVCAVNGVAAGAGANLALCCDIVVAAQSASFIQAFSKIGLVPDTGGTFFLPRLIGWQKASALMMLGDRITAADAERYGMLYKVFADDVFADESMKIASTLAAMPTRALAYTKQALNASLNSSFEAQLKTEDALQYAAANTHDYKEGLAAFLERRVPVFNGE
ncbi:MAG: enoyl-CoA hydratase-related protein [Bacteroidota bacterium]